MSRANVMASSRSQSVHIFVCTHFTLSIFLPKERKKSGGQERRRKKEEGRGHVKIPRFLSAIDQYTHFHYFCFVFPLKVYKVLFGFR